VFQFLCLSRFRTGKPFTPLLETLQRSTSRGEAAIALTNPLQRTWRTLRGGAAHQRRRELVILSMPRTGSSYLCDCLATLPGVVVPREIFNPRGYGPLLKMANAKERFEKILGHTLEHLDDAELHRYFLEHPLEAIETLADAAARQRASLMVYKVIHHQLDRPRLEAILTQRRPDVLVLVRRRLDVWISIRKAVAVGKWHHRDTKDVEVAVDVDQFVAWMRVRDDWYAYVTQFTRQLGLAVRVLDYDRDIDRPLGELQHSARELLEGLGVRLRGGDGANVPIRERQDARTDPFAKITNGEALRATLIERGLLDYALSSPLDDRIHR
jgi:LPS sulfotransferase NodH